MFYVGFCSGNDRVGRDEIDGVFFRCNFLEVINELMYDFFVNWIVLFCMFGNK